MQKYYLDACIWFDYFENRKDRFRPLGEWAHSLLNEIVKNSDSVVLSDHLLKELESRYSSEKIKDMLQIIPEKLQMIIRCEEIHAKAAEKIKNNQCMPFGDALHAVLAKSTNAILVTRDTHFEKLRRYMQIKKPEELI